MLDGVDLAVSCSKEAQGFYHSLTGLRFSVIRFQASMVCPNTMSVKFPHTEGTLGVCILRTPKRHSLFAETLLPRKKKNPQYEDAEGI